MTDKEILKIIGRNLRAAREVKDLTQECLAEMAEIHWKTLGYIEAGRRSFGVTSFVRLVLSLELDAHELLKNLPDADKKRLSSIAKALQRKRPSRINSKKRP